MERSILLNCHPIIRLMSATYNDFVQQMIEKWILMVEYKLKRKVISFADLEMTYMSEEFIKEYCVKNYTSSMLSKYRTSNNEVEGYLINIALKNDVLIANNGKYRLALNLLQDIWRSYRGTIPPIDPEEIDQLLSIINGQIGFLDFLKNVCPEITRDGLMNLALSKSNDILIIKTTKNEKTFLIAEVIDKWQSFIQNIKK